MNKRLAMHADIMRQVLSIISRALPALAALFWISACTSPAEHSNPLDPQSPEYTTNGSISGRVSGFYQPYRPLAGAMVELQPTGIIVQSDNAGGFLFGEVPPGAYALSASKDGYAIATLSASVLARQRSSAELHLDGIPVVQTVLATSAHVSTRASAADRYFLEIVADVQDPDGANDVKSVRLEIPSVSFSDTLSRGTGASRWQRAFSPDDVPGIDLANLAGVSLSMVAQDFPGEQARPSSFFVARVVNEVPQPLAPIDVTLQENSPSFQWQMPVLSYAHTFRVEVFRIDFGFPTFVTAISNIAQDMTSVSYPGRLSTGSYYWTVKMIDSFGNSSRSKEAAFQIQ
jgi:hypothetical protein